MPSRLSASLSPWKASWLNERSSRPPMSVTRPTLSAFSEDPEEELPPSAEDDEELEPQPATRPAATHSRASRTAKERGRTAGAPWLKGGAGLAVRPVTISVQLGEQGVPDRVAGEARLDRGTGDILELPL